MRIGEVAHCSLYSQTASAAAEQRANVLCKGDAETAAGNPSSDAEDFANDRADNAASFGVSSLSDGNECVCESATKKRRTKSGVTGVSWHTAHSSWRATYRLRIDGESRVYQKSFSTKVYGSEGALALAIEWRRHMAAMLQQ